MEKTYKIVDSSEPSQGPSKLSLTDWSKCFLCQEDITSEILRCPLKKSIAGNQAGYKTIAYLLQAFSSIDCLPKSISLSRIDDGNGIEETLKQHEAKWHDSCRLAYNKTQLNRAEKRKTNPAESEAQPVKFTRRSIVRPISDVECCFFCGEQSTRSAPLCKAATFGVDFRVRQCALELQDKELLAKLSSGDLIAQDALYHKSCLVSLYNRARATQSTDYNSPALDDVNHGISFAELISYMEDVRQDATVAPIFKLADLTGLYSNRLQELGTGVDGRVHSTDLKNRILAYFPDLEAHNKGRDVILVSTQDVGYAVSKACRHDADGDAVHLANAAKIVRRDMFNMSNHFDGSFGSECQEKSVPSTLLALIGLILYGSNIKERTEGNPQPVLTISQLVMFNTCTKRSKPATSKHRQVCETPLPIYLGIMLHTKTRKRELVDELFHLGLSVSYDRVMDISSKLGEKVAWQYTIEQCVCPPKLKTGLFTTGAVDNLDYNPSSTTSHDSFHGTGISLFQHPELIFGGCDRSSMSMYDNTAPTDKSMKLPDTYTVVPPVSAVNIVPALPRIEAPCKAGSQLIPHAIQEEYRWLEHTKEVRDGTSDKDDDISWATYHAGRHKTPSDDNAAAITSLLPLFYEQAKSVAMIRHSMNVVKSAVEILNPNQIPIIAADQPLYTVAKEIQWTWPTTHGEDHFVIMFGALHIEMNSLKLIGDLLDGSGWTGALCKAGIASIGTADSFVKAAHITRTRRAHQVTACSLYDLLQKSYADYTNQAVEPCMDVNDWQNEQAKLYPQFQFWLLILNLELTVLLFIRSIREGNFDLYVESLAQIVPWCFALDHTHYARWLPVHLRDMVTLKHKHPAIYAEFSKGKFVVKKSLRSFSAMALDQAHEQNNACVKGDGGAVGLTENPSAFNRWMVSGPEMARLVDEYHNLSEERKEFDSRHHEQRSHVQISFRRDVDSLIETIEEMGNPFTEESSDLLVLDSRDIMDPVVADTVRKVRQIGEEQYDTFISERIEKPTVPITEPIKRNKLPLFSRPPNKRKGNKQQQITALKNDCSLFSRLYIASQTRDGDLDEFFMHENSSFPPSLSHNGGLRTGVKSDLLPCLTKQIVEEAMPTPQVDVLVIDGAAIINMLRPAGAKNFDEYANNIFLPYVTSQLRNVARLDIVWDVYLECSLKADTRGKRGTGTRRRVEPTSSIPSNWSTFLRDDDNKTELFSFLADKIASLDSSKPVVSTKLTDVVGVTDTSNLAPCNHEEADSRMLLHVQDAVRQGFRKVTIRTVDTDVLVLAISAANSLAIDELWVAFGVGKHFQYIAAHSIAAKLGPERSVALPMFHAFSGCDTVSSFSGRGKKTAWDTWNVHPEITHTFCTLMETPSPDVIDECLGAIERYVVLLYDRTSEESTVNEARKQLFTNKGRAVDGLPPTRAALRQHLRRASYQAGYCWSQMFIPAPDLPSPEHWGWQKTDGGWEVRWTTLPEATKACRQLIRCGCKKGCQGLCKCVKASLQCTALCVCGGQCRE